MSGTRIQMVLGGSWHDFAGFGAVMCSILEAAGHRVEATNDVDVLTHLDVAGCDVVLLHTCIDDNTSLVHTEAQIDGLCDWVSRGGRLLAIHAATVAAKRYPALKALIGGVFVAHPPQAAFSVYPMASTHPILSGIEAFTAHDEFYHHEYDPSIEIILMGIDEGKAHPLAWTRQHGAGRVAYLSLGHDAGVWSVPSYQRLVAQSVGWLLSDGGDERGS